MKFLMPSNMVLVRWAMALGESIITSSGIISLKLYIYTERETYMHIHTNTRTYILYILMYYM